MRERSQRAEGLRKQANLVSFEEAILPHLDAAYNLARWLTRNDSDAHDVVQEAYLRAFKFFGSFNGGDGRAWLLAIVRNTCYTWLQHHRSPQLTVSIDDEVVEIESNDLDPEERMLQSADTEMVRQALQELPIEFREVVILRELEEMTYNEIANVTELPIGTVMSRLARGRKRLERALRSRRSAEVLA